MTKIEYFLHIDCRYLPLCKKFVVHSSIYTSLAAAALSLVTIKLGHILQKVLVIIELEN